MPLGNAKDYAALVRGLHESALDRAHTQALKEIENIDFSWPDKVLALLKVRCALADAVAAFGTPDEIAFEREADEAHALRRELGAALEVIAPAMAATELNHLVRVNRRSDWIRECYQRACAGDASYAKELAKWTQNLAGNALELLQGQFRRACGDMTIPVYRSIKWWGSNLVRRLTGGGDAR